MIKQRDGEVATAEAGAGRVSRMAATFLNDDVLPVKTPSICVNENLNRHEGI